MTHALHTKYQPPKLASAIRRWNNTSMSEGYGSSDEPRRQVTSTRARSRDVSKDDRTTGRQDDRAIRDSSPVSPSSPSSPPANSDRRRPPIDERTTTTTSALDVVRTKRAMSLVIGAPLTFTVKAARHARKKATRGHTKDRPKKLRPSDCNRKAVEYASVDPKDVPAVMTVLSK